MVSIMQTPEISLSVSGYSFSILGDILPYQKTALFVSYSQCYTPVIQNKTISQYFGLYLALTYIYHVFHFDPYSKLGFRQPCKKRPSMLPFGYSTGRSRSGSCWYSCGVMPTSFLKTVEKYEKLSNPIEPATSLTRAFGSRSIRFACSMR